MVKKLRAAVLGATGMVGQKFIQLLENHPWFKVEEVAASERSASKSYSKVANWVLSGKMPENVADLEVKPVKPKALDSVDLVFSALPAEVARKAEIEFAKSGFTVLSNASAYRMEPDVPVLNPEVNANHIALIDEQRRRRKWEGAIVTNPNCTVAILTLSLKPIFDEFGISNVIVTTMQALSGAGYPGVSSIDMLDNVIPFIPQEEEKVEEETLKILGPVGKKSSFQISTSCNRVAVMDGHLEAVFVGTKKKANSVGIISAMESFRGEVQKLRLPSAPVSPIVVRDEENRPQPRLDRMVGKGMSVVVGRIRKDNVLNGIKYMVLGHNTIRGAAGCSIMNAELLKVRGYI
ncbi:MAG: aspartate-semialdehyde dehydrogenase [Candidatus Bathyarchaeota archaeon]